MQNMTKWYMPKKDKIIIVVPWNIPGGWCEQGAKYEQKLIRAGYKFESYPYK